MPVKNYCPNQSTGLSAFKLLMVPGRGGIPPINRTGLLLPEGIEATDMAKSCYSHVVFLYVLPCHFYVRNLQATNDEGHRRCVERPSGQ